jgi:methylated-DNA-[protein]-cysteine S-methyltransferase
MTWTLLETDLGWCGLAWTPRGLTWLQLPEIDRAATRARLQAKTGEASEPARREAMAAWARDALELVRAHLAGSPQDLTSIPLELSRVTPLYMRIYRATQSVPAGATVTYGELAARVGSPGAARVVGRSMATNPWPVIVPCHRVVAAGGGKGGFSAHGGVTTKEALLKLEGGTLFASNQPSLFDRTRSPTG